MLHATSLTKRYEQVTALSDVSFSVRPGEVLGLIGPNGSGKTTLFECLGGVLPLDGGTLERHGKPLSATDRTSLLFYVPDAIAPWPAQPVRWALDFTIGFFGGTRVRPPHSASSGLTPTLDEVIERLDLGPLLNSPIGTLSKGQRKRAVLAMGLLMPQPVLLADEPFEGLDVRQSRDMARTLRSFANAGKTLFLSIHQIGDAARVCDRFVLLSGGRTRGEGTLGELTALAASRGAPAPSDFESVFLALT